MRRLEVRLTRGPNAEQTVGELAESGGTIYFEWYPGFLDLGLDLAPFKLPRKPGLYEHRDREFGPLPGLFEESLPDGWGRLLMDRHFRSQGLDLAKVSPLDRLAYLGSRTMGALTYHPPDQIHATSPEIDLFELGRNAERVFAGSSEELLPQLLRAGGSPGGARPKILVGVRGDELRSGEAELSDGFEHWIVKFSAKSDAAHAGPVERAYALMAGAAGVGMPETRLFEAKKGRSLRRYFGVRRFDRGLAGRRFHVQTFANLVHANFRIPGSDYLDLLKVTRILTRNHADVIRAYRQMVFNVAAHVRDDHAKNFAFLIDEHDEWRLTPAYDLTDSPGPGGEHTMTLAGEGPMPTAEHCLEVARRSGITTTAATEVIDKVDAAIARWPEFADQAFCPRGEARRIVGVLRRLGRP